MPFTPENSRAQIATARLHRFKGDVPRLVLCMHGTAASQSHKVGLRGGVKGIVQQVAVMPHYVVRLLHVELDLGVIEKRSGARIAGFANSDADQRRAGELGMPDAKADDP